MTRAEIISQLATKRETLKTKEGNLTQAKDDLRTHKTNATAWLNDYNKLSDRKKKESDGIFKYSRYELHMGYANNSARLIQTLKNEINILNSEISTLQNQLTSLQTEATQLASQGLSASALEIEAIARGEANLKVAQAQAETISEDAKNKKVRNIIIWSFVALLLVFLAIFIYKKFIKK
jgi:predicted  nucleic acid-binding Zn-ribbon protein